MGGAVEEVWGGVGPGQTSGSRCFALQSSCHSGLVRDTNRTTTRICIRIITGIQTQRHIAIRRQTQVWGCMHPDFSVGEASNCLYGPICGVTSSPSKGQNKHSVRDFETCSVETRVHRTEYILHHSLLHRAPSILCTSPLPFP